MKLNIGCGNTKLGDYINIDKAKTADVVIDLEGCVLPYPDSSIEEIRATDVLEHIHNLIPLMNECWRVLGGDFYIEVPKFPSDAATADPTHVRYFIPETFRYFTEYTHFQELYGMRPWKEVHKEVTDNRIFITLRPIK